ncbi:MAG: Spy/CpxP family protein refolding chaperone [Armatimonadetes bacterium]|nr:Spy/CpxP family protein refolding chaperone [Armatimonadota bacterium]
MKNKVFAMIAAVALGTTLAFAQAAGPRGGGQPGQHAAGGQKGQRMMMKGGEGMQKIMAQLNLTEKQKQQWKALNDKRMAEFKAMREKNKGGQPADKEAMKAQFKKNQDAYQAELKKILTPAQFEKLQKLMKEEKAKMMQNHPGGANKIKP